MLAPVLVVTIIVVPWVVYRAYREVDDGFVAEWAGAHGLALSPENRPMVSWYLRTARLLRTWGAIGGLLLPTFCALAWSDHLEILGADSGGGVNPGDAMWIFVGYLVGALYAELALVRPVDQARRSASLVPRRLDDYLARRVWLAQRWLGGVVALGILVSLALPYDERFTVPSWVATVTFAAFVAAFTAGLEGVQRWLVRRPQPFTDPSLMAADDAIRSQSVHSLAGAGVSLLLFMGGGVCVLLAASDLAVLRWTMWLPAVVATVLALVACQYVGHRAWRVRRRADRPSETASA